MAKDHKQAFVRLQSKSGDWWVHPDLRRRLIADADEQGSNLSAVAIKILADRYRVECTSSPRRTTTKEDALIFNLRLPIKLYTAIATAAARSGVEYQDVIRADLCAHYGLEIPAAAAAA